MKELETLLERFWITKEEDKDLYYRVKDASAEITDFLEQKLGYKLIINPYMIKLEKLPGKAEMWMGIQEFEDKLEYSIFCMLLVFLEDKSAGEQFILSEVTEFIQASFPGDVRIDWTIFRHRKYMVKVLRFAAQIGIIKTDDGDESSFMESVETEVLYESTGLSRYFVRNFTGNILNYSSWKDIENGEWFDIDKDRGRVRRNRVYRRLIMSPAVYSEGAEDPDYIYIRNQRSLLARDIEEYLDSQLHVHKNGTFLILNPSKNFKDVFPSKKSVSDIVLQINTHIIKLVKSGEIEKREDDIINISKARFVRLLEDIREIYLSGWSKVYREMSLDKLFDEVVLFMKGFSMVEVLDDGREIRLMPLIGKLIGEYPKNFQRE